MRAYFGMLAHYITDDWKLRTELLSIEELEVSHTGENQAAHMYKVLTRFGILKKVCHLQFFLYRIPLIIIKLGTFTGDNVSVNDKTMRVLAGILQKEDSISFDALNQRGQ